MPSDFRKGMKGDDDPAREPSSADEPAQDEGVKEDEPLFKFGPRKRKQLKEMKAADASAAGGKEESEKPGREPLFKFGPRKKPGEDEAGPDAGAGEEAKPAREPLFKFGPRKKKDEGPDADQDAGAGEEAAKPAKEPLFKFTPRKKKEDEGEGEEAKPAGEKESGKLFKPAGSKDSFLAKFAKDKEDDKKGVKPRQEARGRGRSSSFPILLVIASAAAALVAGVAYMYLHNQQTPGYRGMIAVSAATRLDFPFVEGKQSLTKPAAPWAPYDTANRSLEQRYELYVPPDYEATTRTYPLVVVIASEARVPAGWTSWQKICHTGGIIFAGVYNCGDEKPTWERTRITLDVLDDVRRKFRTDPDQTYLVGRGGAARMACRIAFALPELVGGVIALDGGAMPREEMWLRQRVIDRLSVAFVGRENDPTKAEIELIYAAFLKELKVRVNTWVVPAGAAPPTETLESIYQWLQEDVARRRELAKQWPASRIDGDKAPSRTDWSKGVLEEAKQRISDPGGPLFYTGLAQLDGCARRWGETEPTEAATEAQQLRRGYLKEQILKEEVQLQRVSDLAEARSLTAFLTGKLDQGYAAGQASYLKDLAERAKAVWNKILNEGGARDEATKSLTAIDKAEAEGFGARPTAPK